MKEETAAPAKLLAGGGIGETHRAPVKTDPPRIGLHDVRQAFEEHRLSGPAGAKHGKNAAAQHAELDSRQNDVVVEALVEVFDVEQKILCGGAHAQTRNDVMT